MTQLVWKLKISSSKLPLKHSFQPFFFLLKLNCRGLFRFDSVLHETLSSFYDLMTRQNNKIKQGRQKKYNKQIFFTWKFLVIIRLSVSFMGKYSRKRPKGETGKVYKTNWERRYSRKGNSMEKFTQKLRARAGGWDACRNREQPADNNPTEEVN